MKFISFDLLFLKKRFKQFKKFKKIQSFQIKILSKCHLFIHDESQVDKYYRFLELNKKMILLSTYLPLQTHRLRYHLTLKPLYRHSVPMPKPMLKLNKNILKADAGIFQNYHITRIYF